jgi:hypothetical protein
MYRNLFFLIVEVGDAKCIVFGSAQDELNALDNIPPASKACKEYVHYPLVMK